MIPTIKPLAGALLTFFFLVFPACATCSAPLADRNENADPPSVYRRHSIYISTPKTESEEWKTDDADISKVDKTKKLVSFTFDDAPTSHTEKLAAIFAAFNQKNADCPASATVFFNGARLTPQDKTLLSTVFTVGFELGNHTDRHCDLTTLSKTEIEQEIQTVDDFLQSVDGKSRHLLRAPYGKLNDDVKSVANAPIVDWTVDTLDWQQRSAEQIYQTVMQGVFDGAIVLMHDGYPETQKAVKRLLPDLKSAGYQVLSVSQLAKANECVLKNGNVYIRARKPENR